MKISTLALAVIALLIPARVRAQEAVTLEQRCGPNTLVPCPTIPLEPISRPRWYVVPVVEMMHTARDVFKQPQPQFNILQAAYVGAYTADIISTKVAFENRPRTHEIGPFCGGTRSVTCDAASWGGVMVASLIVSHVLLEHGKHRVWKDILAGAILGFGAGNHTVSAWHNARQ